MKPILAVGLAVATIAAGVLGLRAGDSVRRPEGAAERLLHALSIDEAGQVEQWADPAVTEALVDFDADDDTRFATIEVGRATGTGNRATVPARIVRNDPGDTALDLQMYVDRNGPSDRWRITRIDIVERTPVPSNGGPRPARAASGLWLAALATAAATAIAGDALITRLRAQARLRS